MLNWMSESPPSEAIEAGGKGNRGLVPSEATVDVHMAVTVAFAVAIQL